MHSSHLPRNLKFHCFLLKLLFICFLLQAAQTFIGKDEVTILWPSNLRSYMTEFRTAQTSQLVLSTLLFGSNLYIVHILNRMIKTFERQLLTMVYILEHLMSEDDTVVSIKFRSSKEAAKAAWIVYAKKIILTCPMQIGRMIIHDMVHNLVTISW